MDGLKENIRFSERARRNVAILESLRKAGPLTKAEISNMVGLNVVTVTNYINHFIDTDLVVEKDLDVSQGGRRAVLLDLNPDASYSIGIGVNMNSLVAVITNIDGQILSEIKMKPETMGIRDILSTIRKILTELIDQFEGDKSKIKGIGIGIGGVVNRQAGTIKWPEKVGDDKLDYVSIYVPLKEYIERDFGMPVIVENDATVSAFGEYWFYLDSDVRNMLYLFSGVGCGIILGGELYRGSTGSAGELSISNENEKQPADGCFTTRRPADLGIIAELKKQFKKNREDVGPLAEMLNGEIEKLDFDMVVDAVKKGDTLVRNVVREKAKCLGLKAAFLTNLLNPQIIVIGGGIEKLGSELMDEVRETVDSWAFHEMAATVRIVPSRLGEYSVALGASSLVVRNVFAQL